MFEGQQWLTHNCRRGREAISRHFGLLWAELLWFSESQKNVQESRESGPAPEHRVWSTHGCILPDLSTVSRSANQTTEHFASPGMLAVCPSRSTFWMNISRSAFLCTESGRRKQHTECNEGCGLNTTPQRQQNQVRVRWLRTNSATWGGKTSEEKVIANHAFYIPQIDWWTNHNTSFSP